MLVSNGEPKKNSGILEKNIRQDQLNRLLGTRLDRTLEWLWVTLSALVVSICHGTKGGQ